MATENCCCPDGNDDRGRYRKASDWVLRNQEYLAIAFIVVSLLVIILDISLVVAFNGDSISYRIWVITEQHPTIIVAGVFATLIVAWLVRTYWALVCFAGFVGGHLFAHFAVLICAAMIYAGRCS